MAWEAPAEDRPVWCAVNGEKDGVPTAEAVSCVLQNPIGSGPQNPQVAALELPAKPRGWRGMFARRCRQLR